MNEAWAPHWGGSIFSHIRLSSVCIAGTKICISTSVWKTVAWISVGNPLKSEEFSEYSLALRILTMNAHGGWATSFQFNWTQTCLTSWASESCGISNLPPSRHMTRKQWSYANYTKATGMESENISINDEYWPEIHPKQCFNTHKRAALMDVGYAPVII